MRKAEKSPYKHLKQDAFAWIFYSLADVVFTFIFELVFILQTVVVNLVPVVGAPLAIIYESWLFSLYTFEYTWINSGLHHKKKEKRKKKGRRRKRQLNSLSMDLPLFSGFLSFLFFSLFFFAQDGRLTSASTSSKDTGSTSWALGCPSP
jgi:hypothetical protein